MKNQPELTVTEFPTAELVPYARNAKKHTREQVEQIEASIREFGFNDPIAVWENAQGELEIIEGHGRVMAALSLQLDKVPIIRLDHLTDEQRRAYTHVHNQLTLNTGFDFEILDLEMEELDFDWGDFGFEWESETTESRSEDLSGMFEDTLGVFIECETEDEQQNVYNDIASGGYKCRLLTL